MKNNKLFFSLLVSLNFLVAMLLTIFMLPEKIPLLSNFFDEIAIIGSKWFLFFGMILPIILHIFAILAKSETSKFLINSAIVAIIFENMLGYSYFCTENNFQLFQKSKISISISLFLALAVFIFVYGAKIKHLAFKSKLGVVTKNSTATEFIWKQVHLFASNCFMLTGLVLSISSIVFCFFNLHFVELAVFALLLIISFLSIEKQARDMNKKRMEMEKRLENQKNKA